MESNKAGIMSSASKFKLQSSDGETFEVSEAVALESQTIKDIVKDGCLDNVIPVPDVKATILAKVIEYLKKHVGEADQDKDNMPDSSALEAWDANFVEVDKTTLFDFIVAAKHLEIKSLLNLTCQKVADMIDGMTGEEIFDFFNKKSDSTVSTPE